MEAAGRGFTTTTLGLSARQGSRKGHDVVVTLVFGDCAFPATRGADTHPPPTRSDPRARSRRPILIISSLVRPDD